MGSRYSGTGGAGWARLGVGNPGRYLLTVACLGSARRYNITLWARPPRSRCTVLPNRWLTGQVLPDCSDCFLVESQFAGYRGVQFPAGLAGLDFRQGLQHFFGKFVVGFG